MKKFYGIILVMILLGIGGWIVFNPESAALPAIKPQRGPVMQAVYATGTVEPTIMIPITARVSSRLLSLNADEGQSVTKNQVLAQLEDIDVQGRLGEAQAQADLAEKDFNRKLPLAKKEFVSKQDLDQAQASLKSAAATVEQIKAEMGYLQLLAPEDGTIIRRDGEIGQLVSINTPVFWLSCCAPLRISSEVDEEDISLVKPGQEVFISADAFPDQVFKGKVQSITPKGDAVARSYRVRIGIDAKDTPLMIGMTAETNIMIVEKKNALLVPASSVRNKIVWIANKGKVEKHTIETGAQTPDIVEITKGISETDIILIRPDAGLTEGDKISITLQKWDAH